MDTYNFDKEISRRNTNSLKYDFAAERGYPADVLPLWVADMDFLRRGRYWMLYTKLSIMAFSATAK